MKRVRGGCRSERKKKERGAERETKSKRGECAIYTRSESFYLYFSIFIFSFSNHKYIYEIFRRRSEETGLLKVQPAYGRRLFIRDKLRARKTEKESLVELRHSCGEPRGYNGPKQINDFSNGRHRKTSASTLPFGQGVHPLHPHPSCPLARIIFSFFTRSLFTNRKGIKRRTLMPFPYFSSFLYQRPPPLPSHHAPPFSSCYDIF